MKFKVLLPTILVCAFSIGAFSQTPFARLAQNMPDYSLDDQDVPQRTIVHSGNSEITGSLGIGVDIPNNHNYGADTFVLAENNLRIYFWDTSTTGAFPSNDWRLTANDQNNGGANYFSIDDVTAGNVPFRVQAGSGNNALVLSSNGGNVGLGTANPVLELQITDGDTPGIRLEQDLSGGYPAHTWDVAANETNFFIRDVTNASALPFRIQGNTQGGALTIGSVGNVGIGLNTNSGFSNPNASVELRANNKGLQLNRLTNAQRTALGTALGAGQVGVIVYDTEDQQLYTWDGTTWNGGLVDTDNQTIDVFQLNGNNLELSLEDDGVATQTVDLSSYLDNTDNQVADVFQLNGNNLELSLEDDGVATQTVDLSSYLDNTDNQVADVFQLNGNNLELSLEDDGVATQTVDLSGYLDNTDNQNISGSGLAGNILTIGISGGTSEDVDLSVFNNPGTDDQQISLSGNILNLEDGGSVDLSGYLDNTDNQNISGSGLAGNILTIGISGGTSEDVDLSVFNNPGTDDQQISLSGNILNLEDGGSVDLSGYLDNTDNQNIIEFSLTGTTLKLQIENANFIQVDLASILIPLQVENANQQIQIDDLIARVEFLESCACQLPVDDFTDPNSPYLFQNAPNPYSEITNIRYYIPFEFNKAEIVLTTTTGQILKRIPINQVGEGSVDFSRSGLSSGVYLYTLYLDGKRIDTKRMLIE
ncbi:MAG: T9SS type A sorting domain-containing protein [Flavobacteriaceae bacterium]|nr:T9SS type A sorting domain-containing protein [Flavobacteriaceae bacterium]